MDAAVFLSVLILLVALATLVMTGLIYRHLRAQPERRAVRPTWSQADISSAPPALDVAPKDPAKKWASPQPDALLPSVKQDEKPPAPQPVGDGASGELETPFRWNEPKPPAASTEPEPKQDDDEGFAWL